MGETHHQVHDMARSIVDLAGRDQEAAKRRMNDFNDLSLQLFHELDKLYSEA